MFGQVGEQAVRSTALIDLIATNPHDKRAEHLATRLNAIVETLLEREKASNRIDARVTSADVILSFSMLAFALSRTSPDERPDVSARAQAIFRAAFHDRDAREQP